MSHLSRTSLDPLPYSARDLRIALASERITQRELAEASGIHYTTLSLILNGRFVPVPQMAERLRAGLERLGLLPLLDALADDAQDAEEAAHA